ncbi:triple tyrosine motif-containing protein [Sphingomonas sp. HF-S3]|uniref:Triple tyrosine motif-containing protein n=2 Tax=Sphingomonas rustica TaxID=3103142 RepID=A0ABV0BDI2_9SPHN
MLRVPVTALLLFCLVFFAARPAGAQYARLGLPGFQHSRWTTDDGVPPTGLGAMAQTPDGWLWFTSAEGLYRFDGVTFERIDPPPGSPMERNSPFDLVVAPSGELWISYRQNGGLAVYRDGGLHPLPMPKDSPAIGMPDLRGTNTVWAINGLFSGSRLYQWSGGRWTPEGSGLSRGYVDSLCRTSDGTLWASTHGDTVLDATILSRAPTATRFQSTPIRRFAQLSCAIDPTGRMWIADKGGVRLVAGSDGKVIPGGTSFPAIPNADSSSIAFDAAGGIWGGTNGVGIFYIPDADAQGRGAKDRLQLFDVRDGLTADGVNGLFIDRENHVWFSSDAGLNRFRRSIAVRETRVPGNLGEGYTLQGGGDQTYVVTTAGVFRLGSAGWEKLFEHMLAGLCLDNQHGFWGVRDHELLHVRDGKRRSHPLPENAELSGSCAQDRFGRLWFTLYEGGAIWYDSTGWHRPDTPLPQAIRPDFVQTPTGGVAYVAEDSLVRLEAAGALLTPLEKYDLGEIFQIASGPRDIFISGNNALLRIRGNRISRIDARRFPWVARLRGMVQTPAGETWLRRALWVSRVSTAELDRAFEDPTAPLNRTYFDLQDGVFPALNLTFPGPQIGVGEDGRIWLPDRQGLAHIDPAKLKADLAPPPVVIRSLVSGGTVHRDPARLVLPAGTRALDIGYAALSYAAPHRIQFRYQLEGVDDDWVSPGGRRLASYANLGPGSYRFRVLAANGDGMWNDKGAVLEFEIPPTFLQSWPFKLLCALAVVLLLWIAYRIRLRTVTNRIKGRMAERVAERERIARELHDTLLQAVQSLTLRFQLIVQDLGIKGPPRVALEAALDRADQVIAEGRDRVLELRTQQEGGDLAQMLADIAHQQDFGASAVVIATVGTPRRLDPTIQDEIARIAGEAIFNVRRHARAKRMAITIRYQSSFGISVVDDGVGIDPQIADKGREGHFGLGGMHERASRLKGRLTIAPGPQGGTIVELTVPGRIAYASGRTSRLAGIGFGK